MENTTSTYTVTYGCPYQTMCSDSGVKCGTCANNPSRSYYIPTIPYSPYIPYYPWDWTPTPTLVYPWVITYGTTTSGTTHYQST